MANKNSTRISKDFFNRSAEVVAMDLLGKVLVRKIEGKVLKSKILETEAYFSEDDPASWARLGKRKDNVFMWSSGGTILIKNVHKYKMLNFSTGKEGKAEAVLVRAVEPLNFFARGHGPGLLTEALKIDKSFNGKSIFEIENFFIEMPEFKNKILFERTPRIGVKNDLDIPLRFCMIKEKNKNE
jgi:DNA-3-methyladenine glycosylase